MLPHQLELLSPARDADIGIEAASDLIEIGRPKINAPGPDDHKFSRGLVTVIAGGMAGATALSNDAPVQRFWRDAHAGRVHAANDPERAYLIFGNHEFGLPPGDTMV